MQTAEKIKSNCFLWLYELSEDEVQNKNLDHNLVVASTNEQIPINLIRCEFSQQTSYLENICIFQPDPETFLADRFWIQQSQKSANAISGDRFYCSPEYKRSAHGKFLWNFEIKPNHEYHQKNPAGKAVHGDSKKILAFLYYIFDIEEPFNTDLLVDFLEKLQYMKDLKLEQESVESFFEVFHCTQNKKHVKKDLMNLACISALGILPGSLNLPPETVKALKNLRIDFLKPQNEKKILNIRGDEKLQKYFLRGLSAYATLKHQLDEDEFIAFFGLLRDYPEYQAHIVNDLKVANFKFSRLTEQVLVDNNFFADKTQDPISLLIFLLESFTSSLTVMSLMGKFINSFFAGKANEPWEGTKALGMGQKEGKEEEKTNDLEAKDKDQNEGKIPWVDEEERKNGINQNQKNRENPSVQQRANVLSIKDEEILTRYLKDRIVETKLSKGQIPNVASIYSSLSKIVPESIQLMLLKWIIHQNLFLEQINELYLASQNLFESYPELKSQMISIAKKALSSNFCRIEDICRIFSILSKLPKNSTQEIFDQEFVSNVKCKLEKQENFKNILIYGEEFRSLVFSDLIFPSGCMNIVQKLLRSGDFKRDERKFLINEILIPHEGKVAQEDFAKELRSAIRFLCYEHGTRDDLSWLSSIILEVIQGLNPNSTLSAMIARDYWTNCHSKKSVTELLEPPNYGNVLDQEIFRIEYVSYLIGRILSEIKINNTNDPEIKDNKDGQEERAIIEAGFKKYAQILKPSAKDSELLSNLKPKILKALLNLLDSDQVHSTLQAILFEDPRTDHFCYILLETAIFANLNHEEIKILDIIVTTLNEIIQNLMTKDFDMQTVGKLATIVESEDQKRTFISYLEQTQQIIKPQKMVNIQEALENIVAACRNIWNEYQLLEPYIKSTVDISLDGNALIEAYAQLKEVLDKMKVKDFGIPEEWKEHYKISKAFSAYSKSWCFKYNLEDAIKQLNKDRISMEEYKEAIIRAVKKYEAVEVILPALSELKFSEVEDLVKKDSGVPLNIGELSLTFDENISDFLKGLLKKFQDRDQIRELCGYLLMIFKIFNISRDELSISIEEYLNMFPKNEVTVKNFMSMFYEFEFFSELLKNEVLSTLIGEIASAEDLIIFVQALDNTDLKTMIESLDEHDESLLRVQSIVELNIVKQFISKLDKTSEVELLRSIEELTSGESKIFKGIEKFLESCKSEINAIKNLYKQFTSINEANKTKIIEIVKDSLISITFQSASNSPSNEYIITLIYDGNKMLSISETADLRDRALLVVSKEKNVEALIGKDNQDGINSCEQQIEVEKSPERLFKIEDYFNMFIEIADVLLSVEDNLIRLNETGHPDIFQKKITITEGNDKNLRKFESETKGKLNAWEENIKQCVKKDPILANFYGQQYWILEKTFRRDCKQEEQIRGLDLLRYVNPKISMKDIEKSIEENKEESTLVPKDRLQKLSSKLSKLFDSIHGLPKEEIPIKYKQRYNFELGRMLLTKCADNFSVVDKILTIYAKPSSCSHYPASNQILFCSRRTSWEHLRSFLYLIFADTTGSIFTLVNADKLPFSLKSRFTQTFKGLHEEYKQPKFRFAIICNDSDSQLYAHFIQYSIAFTIKESVSLSTEEIKDLLIHWKKEAIIVTSDRNGLGKTHLIKSLARKTQQTLISFIISGNVNLATYAERLCSNPVLRRDNEKIALHLDISNVDNYAEINELLFILICLRAFKIRNDAFICNHNVTIYLEIANTWSEKLRISLPFCTYFKQKSIGKLDLKYLDHENSFDNPILQACNYLALLEEDADKRKSIDYTEINIAEKKNAKLLEQKICAELLVKHFIDKQESDHRASMTYSQIMTFCKMLSSQASNLSSSFLSVEGLSYIFEEVQNQEILNLSKRIRSFFLEVLVRSAEEFTMRSVFSSKSSQYQTIHELNQPENEIEINKQIHVAIAKSVVSWEDSNHLTLLFGDEGRFIPVYRNFKQVSDNLRTIILSQNFSLAPNEEVLAEVLEEKNLNEYGGKEILRDYSKLAHRDLLAILKDIENLRFTEGEEEIASDDKLTDYVLTPDNFLKMALIMNRIKAGTAVVIMGETGCGKTSLVKYLATKVLKQEFESFNLHAGITEATFLKRMAQYIKRATHPKLAKSNLWLFLDEFNTCDSIGLISEMICNSTLLGNPLPKDLRLIAACNPYKIKSAQIDVGLVQKKTSTRLLHKVHPLPHSLMDFVWDYGSLQQSEEKKYIMNMIGTLRLDNKTTKLITELISEVQEFIRTEEDSSSVSLRDVNRFKQIFSWFRKSLATRPEPAWVPRKKKFSYWIKGVDLKNPEVCTFRAIILALTHCYIYRFSKKGSRKLLIQKCVEVMKANDLYLSEEKFNEICNDEQEDYLYRMNLPKGIALNSALKENVFTALVCILNKVPCFICGKPGCSKTLTVQLLSTNLRGLDSIEPFFQTLPEVYVVTFQGSESSTSEGIEKVFDKAKTLLARCSENRPILPLVVFDEMGLAELSPNNPLKVLHSLLEPEKAEIAFLGISNWRLDASKMNRVVFLARPDPDLEDLELTAISIHQSYALQANNQDLMKYLAQAYFRYKEDISSSNKETLINFHGTRDFYYLIKYVTQEILSLEEKSEKAILEKVNIGFERNFSGREGSSEAIKNHFKGIYNKQDFNLDPMPVLDLVEHNLKDKTARYLMIISRGSASYILEKHFSKLIQNKITLVGSKFPADLDTEEYAFRILSEVILYIEKGWTLVMEGLDNIYGSLFVLFNQNFSVIGQRKNCRIALGSVTNPMCVVDDNFRCIVLVNENEVAEMEPPFLNRFEKYILNFKNVMAPRQLNLAEKLDLWVKKLTTPNNETLANIPLETLLCNYNRESACSLILNHDSDEQEKNDDVLLKKCKKDLIRTASSYLLFFAQYSVLQVEEPEEVQFFNEIYLDEKNPTNIEEAILNVIYDEGILKQEPQKLVVYTFENILANLRDYLNKTAFNYDEVNVGDIYSEKEISDKIRSFLFSDKDLLTIRSDGTDHLKHLSRLDFLINKISSSVPEPQGKSKHFCIIIHLPLNLIERDRGEGREFISYLTEWHQLMIDNFGSHPIKLYSEIMNQSSQDIIKNGNVLKLDNKILIEMVETCFFKFKYTLMISKQDEDMADYFDNIIIKLCRLPKDDKLWEVLPKQLLTGLEFMKIPDWKKSLISNKELLQKRCLPLETLKYWIKKQLDLLLSQLLLYIEKNSAFESYFTDYEDQEITMEHKSIWLEVLQNYNFDIQMKLQRVNQSIEVHHVNGLNFAFSYREFKHILDTDIKVAEVKEEVTNIQQLFEEIKGNELLMKYCDSKIEEEQLEHQNMQEANLTKLSSALEFCKKKTSYRDHFDTIIQKQSLRDKYIVDVISIYVTERMKKPNRFVDFLHLLVMKLLIHESRLYKAEVYYLLYKYECVFSKLTDIMELYEKIGSLSELTFELNEGLPVKYSDVYGREKWLLYCLDLLLQSIKPSKQLIEKIGSFEAFLANLQAFIIVAFSIKTEMGLDPKNLEVLQLWNEILLNIGFISDETKKIQFVSDISNIIADDECFLKNEEVLIKIRNKIESFCSSEHKLESLELVRLKTLLYIRYLNQNIGYKIIFEDIIADPKLLAHSGPLVDMIFSDLEIESCLNFLKDEENDILGMIEEALGQCGTNSPFAALLSETIIQLVDWPELTSESHIVDFLIQYLKPWITISTNVDSIFKNPSFAQHEKIKYGNLYVVAGSSILKKILQVYATALIEEYELPPKAHKSISNTLSQTTGPFNTLRVFLAKCLNAKLGSTTKLKELVMKEDYLREWGLKIEFGSCESVLDINAFPLKFKDKYREIEEVLSKMLTTNMNDKTYIDAFNGILEEAGKDGIVKLCLLQAITNKIYLMQANKTFKQSHELTLFSDWINANQAKIQVDLGNDLLATKLITLYCENFPLMGSFKINEFTDIKKLQMASVKVFFINTIASLKDCSWPFTDIFFENGRPTKFLSPVMAEHYLVGLPESKEIDYLMNLVSLNFKAYTEEEISRGQWNGNLGCALYQCSDTCDYYYAVGECTRVLENNEDTCWAGHLLGGTDYNQPHQRPGHSKILQGEKEILMKTIMKLRASESKGYSYEPVKSRDYAPRNLQPIAYHILQFLLHEALNFVYLTKQVEEAEIKRSLNLEKTINLAKYLEQQVSDDWKSLSDLLESTDNSNLYIVLNGIMSGLADLATEDKYDTKILEGRDKFETKFQEKVANITQNLLSSINKFKVDFGVEPKEKLTDIPMIQEIFEEGKFDEIKYPLQRLFRRTKEVSARRFRTDYQLKGEQLKKTNGFINLYFKEEENLQKLAVLPHLVKFTNSAMSHYNHRITRNDATNEKKVKDLLKEHPNCEDSFEKLMSLWNTHVTSDIRLGCKIYKRQCLTEESPLVQVLPDGKKEQGSGILMTAAFCYLASIQNSFLEAALGVALTNKNLQFLSQSNTTRIAPQMIREDETISVRSDREFGHLIQMFQTFNFEYGKGEEIHYDYDMIEYRLALDLLVGKRFLNDQEEKIAKIHYHFELLNTQGDNSNLISELKRAIPQEDLPPELEKLINEEISLYLRNDRERKEGLKTLKEIFSSVCWLLWFAKNSYRPEDLTVGQYCQKRNSSKISNVFRTNGKFKEIPLKHLVSFYEIVEMEMFESILETIPDCFKKELDEKNLEAMNNLVTKLGQEGLPTIEEFLTFNKRLIVRCLDADLAPDQQLLHYVSREDFWPNRVRDVTRDKLESEIPQTIQLRHAAGGFLKFILENAEPQKLRNEQEIILDIEPPKIDENALQPSRDGGARGDLRRRMEKDKKRKQK